MVEIRTGDIFRSNAQTLVNTVNSVGVMGKGVALQFRQKNTCSRGGSNRELRRLRPAGLPSADEAGMVPPGQREVALFQNTPAQYHGRPELVRQHTEELRELLP